MNNIKNSTMFWNILWYAIIIKILYIIYQLDIKTEPKTPVLPFLFLTFIFILIDLVKYAIAENENTTIIVVICDIIFKIGKYIEKIVSKILD